MLDARWNFSKKSEVYLTAMVAQTDAAYSNLAMAWATRSSDPPLSSPGEFPNGDLPYVPPDQVGNDPPGTAPLIWSNIVDLNYMNQYSDLDYLQIQTAIGTRFQMTENIGFFGEAAYYDLTDDQPYLQDAAGSVGLLTAGFIWSF